MADTKVTDATDITTLAATDVIPVGRPASSTAYKATMAEVGTYVLSTINGVTFGVEGATLGAFELASQGTGHFYNKVDRASFWGHNDDVYYWGYNRNGVSTYPNAALPSISQAIEADYYSDAATHWMEWYVEYRSVAGTTRRPYQTSVNRVTDDVTNQLHGSLVLYSSAGVTLVQMDESGNITNYGGAIVQNTNNVTFLKQMNATGSGYIAMQVNSADQWAIGGDVTMYGDIWFNHANTNGPIIWDRSDGHGYRIKVTAGVLGTEVVW